MAKTNIVRDNINLGESLKSKTAAATVVPSQMLRPSDEAIASKTRTVITADIDLVNGLQSLQNISEHKSGKQISK